MKNLITVSILFILCISNSWGRGLCSSSERQYYNCQLPDNIGVVSLCASMYENSEISVLTLKNKIKPWINLRIPSEISSKNVNFFYSDYTSPGYSEERVGFSLHNVWYWIFKQSSEIGGKPGSKGEIHVKDEKGDAFIILKCNEVNSDIWRLKSFLPTK